MTRQIVFRRAARAEFDAAADWYEAERTGLGRDFLTETERVLACIVTQPGQFPTVYRDIR